MHLRIIGSIFAICESFRLIQAILGAYFFDSFFVGFIVNLGYLFLAAYLLKTDYQECGKILSLNVIFKLFLIIYLPPHFVEVQGIHLILNPIYEVADVFVNLCALALLIMSQNKNIKTEASIS